MPSCSNATPHYIPSSFSTHREDERSRKLFLGETGFVRKLSLANEPTREELEAFREELAAYQSSVAMLREQGQDLLRKKLPQQALDAFEQAGYNRGQWQAIAMPVHLLTAVLPHIHPFSFDTCCQYIDAESFSKKMVSIFQCNDWRGRK